MGLTLACASDSRMSVSSVRTVMGTVRRSCETQTGGWISESRVKRSHGREDVGVWAGVVGGTNLLGAQRGEEARDGVISLGSELDKGEGHMKSCFRFKFHTLVWQV